MSGAKKSGVSLFVLFFILLAGISPATIIDKAEDLLSSRFVFTQNDNPNISMHTDYITSENIGNMVQTVFNPEADYEFEFILGTMDVTDGSDFDSVLDSFGMWVDLPDSTVSVTETSYDGEIGLGGNNGENEISWIPYDGETNWWLDVLGYSPSTIAAVVTWYLPSTGEVVERDMHFNDTYMYWYTDSDGAAPANDPFYVGHIGLHETGHIYGIRDVYNPGAPGYASWMGTGNEGLTMYGYSSPGDEDMSLTSIDITAMGMAHPIPEPATILLLGLGQLLASRKRRS